MTEDRIANRVVVIRAPKEDGNFRSCAPVQTNGLVSDPAHAEREMG